MMDEPKPHICFLFVGNQLCLDFINTDVVLNGRPVDLLATFSDLVAWLVQSHLLTGEEAKKLERQWGRQAKGTQTLERAKSSGDLLHQVHIAFDAGQNPCDHRPS